MASVELRRAKHDATFAELVRVVNRLIDRDLGNNPGRIWLTGGDDGEKHDVRFPAAAPTTGNYPFMVQSAAGNHVQIMHSSGTPVVFRAQDAGVAVNQLSSTGDVLVGGNLGVTGTGSIGGAATVGGTFGVTGASTLTGAVTAASTLQVQGALSADGAVTLGNAAADVVTVTGTATFAEIVTMAKGLVVDTTTLVVDAANNRVGVGIATPQRPLHVVGPGGAVTLPALGAATTGIFENNGNTNIEIFSSTSGVARLAFGDTGAGSVGGLMYAHSTDQLDIQAGSTSQIKMTATGLGFYTTNPVAQPAPAAASTDLATVITLANSLRTGLRSLGLFS